MKKGWSSTWHTCKLFRTASRLPGSEVGEHMISNPASKMGLLRPTSRVAEPRAGSTALVSTRTLSWGIRENRYSCRERGKKGLLLKLHVRHRTNTFPTDWVRRGYRTRRQLGRGYWTNSKDEAGRGYWTTYLRKKAERGHYHSIIEQILGEMNHRLYYNRGGKVKQIYSGNEPPITNI